MILCMQKARYWLVVVTFLSVSPLFGAINPDSLKTVARQQRDSTLSDTYYSLARYYFQIEHLPDSMIKYAQLAAEIASQHRLTSRVMMSKKALGLAYTEARKFELAEKAYADAMTIAEQTKNTPEVIAINNKLGYLFGVANDLTKSAYYYLKTAKEFEQLKDYRNLAITYNNVVVIFTLQDQHDKMIDYTNKALALIPKMKPETDADYIVSVYSSAAQHYFLVGEKEKNSILIDRALLYADSCLQVGTLNQLTSGLADAYYVKGYGQLLRKDFKSAFFNLRKTLAYKKSLPERTVFNAYSAMAKATLEMEDFRQSQKYIDSCKILDSSEQLDGPMIVAEIEYHRFKKMKQDAAALEAYERFTQLREQLLSTERNKAVNDLEVKYQTELKEAKIAELNQQTKIDSLQIRSLLALVGIVLLVVAIVVFLYRQSLIKSKLNTMEIEQRLNRARMNPHFFFNALTSLQQYALRQTDGVAMASSLSRFSNVMRTTLESTYLEYITLEAEITFLNEYLGIQKIRHPKTFSFSITPNPNLEIDEIMIPPMIIQPFVENSIEHGLTGIDYEGNIAVEFEKAENELLVMIKDNGKGFSEKENKTNEHISRATQIINDRIYLLNRKGKSNARYQVSKNSEGLGVLVSISLPLIYKK
jgi:tetratricopeptide (TPR) repeat protein